MRDRLSIVSDKGSVLTMNEGLAECESRGREVGLAIFFNQDDTDGDSVFFIRQVS